MRAPEAKLPPNLDILAAAQLKDMFAARRGAPIDLDASDVQRLGGQCLQVLLAAQACWRADGLEFVIRAPSDAFCECARLLGVRHLFGISTEGAAS